jgi:acyl-coenzyme A synthetase/AMP-(fatty) acid ligase
MAAIKDFVLHSKTPFKSYKEKPEWNGKSFIEVVFQCIRDEIKYKGERPWLVDTTTGETLSIGQVEVEALKAAEVLRASGLGKGDVLHVVVPNSIKFHVTVFGAWLLGAAASVADPSLNEDILKTQLDETKAKVVVCNAESLQKVSRAARNAAVVVRVEDYDAASPTEVADNYIKSLINANNEDTMVIFWSSGTTGRPKGIAHTNNFLFNVLKKSAFPPSTLLQSTCFFHTGGFFAPIDGGLYNGFIIAFMDPNKAISMQDIVGAVNKVF